MIEPADRPVHDRGALGAGGMGEVYRARDQQARSRRGDQDAAARTSPADPERRARSRAKRETLVTLNHPHIGAIYGMEDSDGITALVLELVEGPRRWPIVSSADPCRFPALSPSRARSPELEAAHELSNALPRRAAVHGSSPIAAAAAMAARNRRSGANPAPASRCTRS